MVAIAAPVPDLTEVVRRVQPVTLAGERVLPVSSALCSLFPGEGLRRGSTVGVCHSTSLLCSLIAEATTTGSWAAIVGMPTLGVVAASEAGVDLDRVAFVPRPSSERWTDVVAALIDGVDIVVVRRRADHRLASRVRDRGCVLIVADPRPEVQLDVRLEVTDRSWRGIGRGHGHLDACEIQVTADGRGAASRLRRETLHVAG